MLVSLQSPSLNRHCPTVLGHFCQPCKFADPGPGPAKHQNINTRSSWHLLFGNPNFGVTWRFRTSNSNVGAVLQIDLVDGRLEELSLGLPHDHRCAAGRVLESGGEKPCGIIRKIHNWVPKSVVQLNFTPEIKVYYMLFQRTFCISSMKSLKQHYNTVDIA